MENPVIMSNIRTLRFLHLEDLFLHKGALFKVIGADDDEINCINIKSNEHCQFNKYCKVIWIKDHQMKFLKLNKLF
ncbi:MAG: hypothetical protein AB9836_04725 [Aminipila sp.]